MQVLMPQLGETVTEGTISAWYKAVGDAVAPGDNLFEVETDKATMEVPATSAGKLAEIRAKVGDTLPVGSVVAVIVAASVDNDDPLQDVLRDVESELAQEAERMPKLAAPAAPPPAAPPPVQASAQALAPMAAGLPAAATTLAAAPAPVASAGAQDAAAPPAAAAPTPAAPPLAAPPPAAPQPAVNGAGRNEWFGPFLEVRTPERNFGPARQFDDLKITPLARRLAAGAGIDLAAVAASVRAAGGWRIAKADIEVHAPAPAAGQPAPRQPLQPPQAEPAAPGADADLQPLNRIRRKTAEHLSRAWSQVPHVLQAVEVDFHNVDAARGALNAAHAAQWGYRLSYLPFIARGLCLALREFPRVNASIEGEALRVHQRINLGIAVDLAHEGLVVPVVRAADDLTLSGLARAINNLVAKARAGSLVPDDFSGGTYTISNSGTFGTLITAPIVNQPEVAILSTDGVRKKPVAVETAHGDMVVVHPVGVLAQSFDHRAFDGAYSAAFLNRLREILETRDWSSDIS